MVGSWFSDALASNGSMTGSGPASQSKGAPGSQLVGAPGSTTSGAPGSQWMPNNTPAPAMGPSPYAPSGVPWPVQAAKSALAGQATHAQSTNLQDMQNQAAYQQLASTFYGPQQQILANQLNRQMGQFGMIGEDVNYRQGALNRDTALAREGLGLDRQALGVDRDLTKSQQANLGRLRGILGQQFGLNDRDLTLKLNQLGVDESQLKDMAKRQQWDLRSQLTQRGAFNTVANERGTGRINRDLGYGLFGIGTQRGQAKLGHEGAKLGLQEKGIGYDNQAAGLNAKLKGIGIDTQRIGLSEQQLGNTLQDGLRQIGLDGYMNVNQLLDAIGGTNTQQAQMALEIYNFIAGMQGIPLAPTGPAPRTPDSYGGGSYKR